MRKFDDVVWILKNFYRRFGLGVICAMCSLNKKFFSLK